MKTGLFINRMSFSLIMPSPIMSPDGNWMWTGSEWIPAPPKSAPQTINTDVALKETLREALIEMDVATIDSEEPFAKAAQSSAVGGVLLFFLLIPLFLYLFPFFNPLGTIGIVVFLLFGLIVPFVLSSKSPSETGITESLMQVAIVAFLVYTVYSMYNGK